MSTAKKAPAKKAPAKKVALKPAPIYKRLKGQRVFITGAGSGIGRATALRFAAEGAQLALADLRGAKETAAEIKKAGGNATAYDLDVTKAVDVEKVVNKAAKALGGLDIVCNIAGIGHLLGRHFDRFRLTTAGAWWRASSLAPAANPGRV